MVGGSKRVGAGLCEWISVLRLLSSSVITTQSRNDNSFSLVSSLVNWIFLSTELMGFNFDPGHHVNSHMINSGF